MDSPSKNPLQDISNNASPPSSSSDEVFKRLSMSPTRNHRLLDKPAVRLSPQQRIQTPKRLPSPDILRPTQSLDRYDRPKSKVVKINEIVFPNSPTKTTNVLKNVPVSGGDGSLSRIRNRFKINNPSPVKMNLLDRLHQEESPQTKKELTTHDNDASVAKGLHHNYTKGFRVERTNRKTRSKSVMFKLPEDRLIALELNEMKKLNNDLLSRVAELEERVSTLERKLP